MAEKKQQMKQPQRNLDDLMARDVFYKDSLSLVKLVVVVELGAIIALVASIAISLGLYDVRYRYFPTTSTGEIVKVSPLSDPGRSEGEILNWTAMVVPKLFTFGPHDFRTRISEASAYFTDMGHRAYIDALNERYLNEVKENKRLLVATITGAPRMWDQRIDSRTGVYNWCVQVPVKIVFTGGTSSALASGGQQTGFNLTLRITRVSALKSKEGIGISQFIAVNDSTKPRPCW